MIIKRKSPLTGQVNTMDIDVTKEQLRRWKNKEGMIQHIMPNLTPAEREFIMTGYTQSDWDRMFPKEEE